MNVSLKNFGFKHKSGILMPISSLPSDYGIGSFGKEAYRFVDFLCDTKTKCWQVLPMNPTSYGDSPYQSPASVAGNPYFIDLDVLFEKGLLTKDDLKESKRNTKRVDYGDLFVNRYPVLRKAYAEFLKKNGKGRPDFKSFIKKNVSWLPDYSLFMALKVHYNYSSWTSWSDEHKNVNKARLCKNEFSKEIGFWSWVQYEFYVEWQALLKYAHSKGIVIIGDMPIYVAHDSMDVWQSPEQFLLDESFNPTVVAGCPPDAFSDDGQLWGNPIYNWELMELDGFSWWIKRVGYAFKLYDILRIDHFRGFAGYYNIPYGDTTAKGGKWDSAPGIKLFRTLNSKFKEAKIIAEDLGFITPDVRELLTDTGFPGMKMLQFAFFDEDNEYLPRMYKSSNCVVYPGSHDSDCIKSWLKTLDPIAKRRFSKECPRNKEQSRTYDLIELALASRANLAVVQMQDYLELTNSEGRMNTPSVADGNWNWRLSKRYRTKALTEKIEALAKRTKRATK
ncbi:MAG: 4-alpha-glucanotransferase [Clostridia bacterium]|nr:4-alpha-glucanotransferase [Clostridia bacterium]